MNPATRDKLQIAAFFAKALAFVMLLAALAYAAIVVFLYVKQRDLIYYPQYTRDVRTRINFEMDSDGVHLRGWVVSGGLRDAVIYFGGNGESIEYLRDSFREWAPGRTAYLVPYRGYGPNTGVPEQQHLFADALALYDVVQGRHPQGRIAVVGRSLGTGVASYVASQRTIDKLVLVTPFDSMVSVASFKYPWLPVGLMLNERFESSTYLHDVHVPILILQAGRDEVVPAAATSRLIDALTVPPKVVVFSRANHNSISRSSGYDSEMTTFLVTD